MYNKRLEEFALEDIEVGDKLQWKAVSGCYFEYGDCYEVIRVNPVEIMYEGASAKVSGDRQGWNLIKKNPPAKAEPKQPSVKMPFKEMKFRVNSPEHSKEIQKYLMSIGYDWEYCKYKGTIQFTESTWLSTDSFGAIFQSNDNPIEVKQEYKLIPQTTYTLKEIPPIIELVNILGKQYNKAEVEKLLANLEEVCGIINLK